MKTNECIQTSDLSNQYDTLERLDKLISWNFYKNEITIDNVIDFIDTTFSPKVNGFTVKKYNSSFKTDGNCQVWSEGPVLLKMFDK